MITDTIIGTEESSVGTQEAVHEATLADMERLAASLGVRKKTRASLTGKGSVRYLAVRREGQVIRVSQHVIWEA